MPVCLSRRTILFVLYLVIQTIRQKPQLQFFFSFSLIFLMASTSLHPADVSNEMHSSLREKIMLPPCDRSCTSSTKCARGVSPFGNGAGFCFCPLRNPPFCEPRSLHPAPPAVNRLGWQSCGGTGVMEGLAEVKQEWKESIHDESEGVEGRFT